MVERKLSPAQREVIQRMMHLILTGNDDAEEINRLCGRLFELFPPEHRRNLENSMARSRLELFMGALQDMGYVT